MVEARRHVVGNLTTVTNSLRDFTALLLGYYFAERVSRENSRGSELETFLKWEQLEAYSRAFFNDDYEFRGTERVKKALGNGATLAKPCLATTHPLRRTKNSHCNLIEVEEVHKAASLQATAASILRASSDGLQKALNWLAGGRGYFNDARVLTVLFLLLTVPVAAATLTGKADIVDGDTIKVGGIPVRLYGIDAPEGRQTCERDGKPYACGKQATKALANFIAGQAVQCEIVGRDNYARALGVCTVSGTELNRTMVRDGWALAFIKYSDRYAVDQIAAETSKAGLWAGSFVKPWEWRLGEAQAAEKTRACAIKGNINRNGERIYHLPFQQFYRRTKIDESKGERWFCTEQEAREAGWLRALR